MFSKFSKIFNSKNFDNYIISLSKKCINFINNAKIITLNDKADGSALSTADLKVNEIIENGLRYISSSIPILSEENNFSESKYLESLYWLIDPIDGTKSYISGGEQFTVNISLIHNGSPLMGMIAHPPSKSIWYSKRNKLIILNKNSLKKIFNQTHQPVIITSKERNIELKCFLNKLSNYKKIIISSSLKFCFIAENKADIYPRFSSINKWDIAAGHAIVNASGGQLIDLKGKIINYQSHSSKTGKFVAISKNSSIKTNFFTTHYSSN